MADSFDADRVEAVMFDSFGTLVDTGSAARVLEDIVDDPDAVARRWRGNALTYSLVANDLDQYETYFELHRLGLRDALLAEGVDLDDDRLRELNEVYYDLDPVEGAAAGVERLAEAGYKPSVCSNGDPEMLTGLAESAGIADSVAELVSADEIRTLKPARELYEHAAERVGADPERIAHVTAHWVDVQGGMNAGMQGVHLKREGTGGEWPSFGPGPTLTVDSFDALCDLLDA
jgi:2-haloacid dehalogenase